MRMYTYIYIYYVYMYIIYILIYRHPIISPQNGWFRLIFTDEISRCPGCPAFDPFQVDEEGRYSGEFFTVSLAGDMEGQSFSDRCLLEYNIYTCMYIQICVCICIYIYVYTHIANMPFKIVGETLFPCLATLSAVPFFWL